MIIRMVLCASWGLTFLSDQSYGSQLGQNLGIVEKYRNYCKSNLDLDLISFDRVGHMTSDHLTYL